MSKLAERIRRASRIAPAPLGFTAAAAPAPEPTLLSLVRLQAHEAAKAAEAASRGADAVIIDGLDPNRAAEVAAKAQGLIVGARVPKLGRREAATLRAAGVDFLVMDLASAAEAMLEEGIGFVLALGKEADETTLRLLADLSLDAAIAPPQEAFLTVGKLLDLRRIAALSRTPLLCETAPEAGAAHLQLLRDSGVAGVIVDSSGLGKLDVLRQTIAALPARGRRREERAEAVLPVQVLAGHGEEEEEEEEERLNRLEASSDAGYAPWHPGGAWARRPRAHLP